MEALRPARQINTATNVNENTVQSREIPQITDNQHQYSKHKPQMGKILPKQQQPNKKEQVMPKMGKTSPEETHQVTDLEAMEEEAAARTPIEDTREKHAHPQHMPTREYDAEGAESNGQDSL